MRRRPPGRRLARVNKRQVVSLTAPQTINANWMEQPSGRRTVCSWSRSWRGLDKNSEQFEAAVAEGHELSHEESLARAVTALGADD